jgi:hypothetical protein
MKALSCGTCNALVEAPVQAAASILLVEEGAPADMLPSQEPDLARIHSQQAVLEADTVSQMQEPALELEAMAVRQDSSRKPTPTKEAARQPVQEQAPDVVDENVEEEEDRCHVCGEADEGDVLLLCDSCDNACHLACAQPPLKRIPKGECLAVDSNPEVVSRGHFMCSLNSAVH